MFERAWIKSAPPELRECLVDMGVTVSQTVYISAVDLSGEEYIYDRDVFVCQLASHIALRRMKFQDAGTNCRAAGIEPHWTVYVLTGGHPINEGSNGRYVHTPPSDAYLAARAERE